MNSKKFLALVSVAVGLSFSFNAYAAKEIKSVQTIPLTPMPMFKNWQPLLSAWA